MGRYFSVAAFFALILLCRPMSAGDVWDDPLPNIYWGDLHVHTNLSWDAYGYAMAPGVYTDEAGLFGTYCAKLDFFAFTDHAEGLTDPNAWDMTIASARKYNDLGRSHPDAAGDPGVVAFVGFEWTQSVPWGHKNVIFKYDDEPRLTPGPIPSSRQIISRDMIYSMVVRTLFPGGKEALDPALLFERLDRECLNNGSGCEATVIPHGNAWGNANFRTNWDIQNNPDMHRPDLQRSIEVYSKHGNSEEYKYFPPEYRYYMGGVEVTPSLCGRGCEKVCQDPTPDYEPCCYRAGEIVRQRCLDPNSEFCREQIELARQNTSVFPRPLGPAQKKLLKPEYRDKPGRVEPGQWQSCGNCRTCFQPAWNYLPNSSVQKALVTYGEDGDGNPAWFRFGFVGSTDTHQGRPGSVKEVKYFSETDRPANALVDLFYNRAVYETLGFEYVPGPERASFYFNPGGLVAIQSDHRTGADLFDSLVSRHAYATSGARIEVWLRAEVYDGEKRVVTMGDEAVSSNNPLFHIKARGSLMPDPTCPYDDEPWINSHMSRGEFQSVCYNQCYRVTDRRVAIDRIEVVKILQPLTREEAAMDNLLRSPDNPKGIIIDPCHVHRFSGSPTQVEYEWTDPEFEREPVGRPVAYYFRVIQAPTQGYQCDPDAYLCRDQNCDPKRPPSIEVDTRANPQDQSLPAPRTDIADPCYTDPADPETFCQERAWTSPVYVIRGS